MRDADPERSATRSATTAPELATILPELRELLPDLAGGAPLDSEGARFRLFDSVGGLPAERRRRTPARARPRRPARCRRAVAPAPAVRRRRSSAGAPILIVGCYRDTEVGAELAAGAGRAVAREPRGHGVALRGLERRGHRRACSTLTIGRRARRPSSRRGSTPRPQGNPLFAVEIGRLLAAEGRGSTGGRRLPDPARASSEAIGRRLQRQSDRVPRRSSRWPPCSAASSTSTSLERVSGARRRTSCSRVLDEAAAARLVGEVPGGARAPALLPHPGPRRALRGPPRAAAAAPAPRVGEALEALYAGNLEPAPGRARPPLPRRPGAPRRVEGDPSTPPAPATGRRRSSATRRRPATTRARSRCSRRAGSATRDGPCELLLVARRGAQPRRRRGGGEGRACGARPTLAEDAGRPDQLARAALGYGGRFVWARASMRPASSSRCSSARWPRSATRTAPRGSALLARLAAALRDEPLPRAQGRACRRRRSRWQADRRPRDARLTRSTGTWIAIEGPDDLAEGRDQRDGRADRARPRRSVTRSGSSWATTTVSTPSGRSATARPSTSRSTRSPRLADELRQPAQRWHVGDGRSDARAHGGALRRRRAADRGDASALGRQRAELERRRSPSGSRSSCCAASRAGWPSSSDVIERSVHEYPALLRFRCALAHLYAELGREREARAVLDELLCARPGPRVPSTPSGCSAMSLLADVCAFLGDARRARRSSTSCCSPYERALRARRRSRPSSARWRAPSACSRPPCGRFDEAERALRGRDRDRAHGCARAPWLAHAQHDLAAMLLARGSAGDSERAPSCSPRPCGPTASSAWTAGRPEPGARGCRLLDQ